jgi:FtsZ-interacting cell division protein YlmF
LPDIDNRAFLESVADYAGLKGFKAMTTEEQKQYIDDSYQIKDYIQQKEIEAQQQAQQAQPQQAQQAQPQQPQQAMPATNGQPSEEEIAMMMQQAQANPDQSTLPYIDSTYPTEQIDESQLDFIMPQ